MGDGLSNLCYPTMSVTIAYLAIGKVPFNKWIRFVMPFLIITSVVSAAFLVVASGLNWSVPIISMIYGFVGIAIFKQQ